MGPLAGAPNRSADLTGSGAPRFENGSPVPTQDAPTSPPLPIEARCEAFVDRLIRTGVAAPGEVRGCSDDEIDDLESRYGVRLPRSYRLFLRRMGQAAGRLGECPDDLLYPAARKLAGMRGELRHLPADFIVVFEGMELPWYLGLRCQGEDDPPVYYFDFEDEVVVIQRTYASWFDFLDVLLEEAIEPPRRLG